MEKIGSCVLITMDLGENRLNNNFVRAMSKALDEAEGYAYGGCVWVGDCSILDCRCFVLWKLHVTHLRLGWLSNLFTSCTCRWYERQLLVHLVACTCLLRGCGMLPCAEKTWCLVSCPDQPKENFFCNHALLQWQSRGSVQRRCNMRHELLTHRALFCIGANAKKGTLSQHFVTRVIGSVGWCCHTPFPKPHSREQLLQTACVQDPHLISQPLRTGSAVNST